MSVSDEIKSKIQGTWLHRPFGLYGTVVNYTFTPTHKITDGRAVAYEVQVGEEGALIVANDETVIVDELTAREMYWRKGQTRFVLTRS